MTKRFMQGCNKYDNKETGTTIVDTEYSVARTESTAVAKSLFKKVGK